jgi:hypothetical protein
VSNCLHRQSLDESMGSDRVQTQGEPGRAGQSIACHGRTGSGEVSRIIDTIRDPLEEFVSRLEDGVGRVGDEQFGARGRVDDLRKAADRAQRDVMLNEVASSSTRVVDHDGCPRPTPLFEWVE